MTKREKTLGIAFGSLFVVLVGGFGGTAAFKKIGDMRAQNSRLEAREVALESLIETRALWEQRSAWINESVPSYATRGKAATELIAQIDRVSNQTGVTVDSKELVEAQPDDEAEQSGGFYESAAMKVRVHGDDESVLAWIHALQQPAKFTGVDSVILESSEEGLTCEAGVRLWFAAEE